MILFSLEIRWNLLNNMIWNILFANFLFPIFLSFLELTFEMLNDF